MARGKAQPWRCAVSTRGAAGWPRAARMVDSNNMRVMQILADATNVIAEGEVLQLMNIHDATLDEAAYLHVIRSKTAKLFEASARLGAVLAGSSLDRKSVV